MSKNLHYSLICAVRSGEVETAKTLIDTFGLSYSEAWSSGHDLLCYALQNKHEEVAKLLLKRGFQVNSKSKEPKRTPLHWAVMRGYINIVTMLLDRNADVNVMDNCSKTPLHCAVEQCNLEIVKLLLQRGVYIDARWTDDTTSLYRAVQLNELAIAEELLNYGAQVNVRCTTSWIPGYTPLHCAVERGNESMIKLLLSKGAEINAIAEHNITPLHVATQLTREKIVKMLLEKGANVDACDKNGKSILLEGVKSGHLTTVECILHFHPDVNSEANCQSLNVAIKEIMQGELFYVQRQKIFDALIHYGFTIRPEDVKDASLLHAAVEGGCANIIESFLKLGADVNALKNTETGLTLLHSAVCDRQFEIAEMLLRHGANPNAKDNVQKQPIFYAIENNDTNMTKLLLSNGNGVEVTTELLFRAVKQEKREIVEILLQLEANMDINARDQYGRTVLHYTALNEDSFFSNEESVDIRSEMAKMFLNSGARVNAKTKNGLTALHLAADQGNFKLVELLLKNKADVNALMEHLTTPLHLAAKEDNRTIVKMLLDYGANINARQKNGRTALHIVASHGRPEITAILLEYGADINVTCKKSLTPLYYAILGIAENTDQLIDAFFDNNDYYFVQSLTFNFHVCPCGEVAEILAHRIVTMKALGLYVSEKNLEAVDLESKYRDILEDCQMEVANMKIMKLGNSNISFYDILTRDMNQLTIYARNESIVEDLESKDFQCDFPSYRGMITRRFKEGQKRESLLNSSLKSLNALSGYFLPDLSAIVLFNYLSNKDLENLIKADPSAAHSDS